MTGDRDRHQQSGKNGPKKGTLIDPQTADSPAVLAEIVDEAVVCLNGDGQITAANSRFAILTATTHDELVGSPIASVVVDSDSSRLAAIVRGLQTRPRGEQTLLGIELRTGEAETVAAQLSLAVAAKNSHANGDTEIVGTVRPVDTAEAELQRRASQQAAVATLGQLALESDDIDELMAEATRLARETLETTYCKVLDLDADRGELLLRQGVGWQPGIVGNATVGATTNSQAGYTLSTDEPVIVDDLSSETRFSGPELLTSHDVTSGISVCIGSTDDPWGIFGVHDRRRRQFSDDDVNFVQSMANVLASAINHHQRTAVLTRYEQVIETVDDSVYAVEPSGEFTMVNRAFCELTGYSRDELLETSSSVVVGQELQSSIQQLEAEMLVDSVSDPTIEGELTTADGNTVVIEATFALVPTDDSYQRVAIVRDVSQRKAHEKQLETERTKLAALNEVNTVVRQVTDAILDQSTRHEIEQVVCESLSAFDTYRFAWIGEVDSRTNEIEPHVEAGTAGYLDDVSISTDPSDPRSRGPAGRAVETQQLQVSQNVFTDPAFEPWRAVAAEWDYQSVAAIPITHDGTLYGVLGLYSHVTDAFAPEKQAIIQQLGEIVGHAIAAVERKQALMSDTVTELQLEIGDVFTGLGETVDSEIILDHVVPTGGEMYLQYGRTTPDVMAVLESLPSTIDSWESVTVLSDSETECRFELRLSEPPVTSMVAENGGSITDAVISDNELRMTIQLPPSMNVRRLVNRLQAVYPTTRPIARRQHSRAEATTDQITTAWSDLLTDRQRASVEAAYFAGFFEWPRNSSGQDLAEAMGVAPATFHQHLRAAERKLFGVVIGGTDSELTATQ